MRMTESGAILGGIGLFCAAIFGTAQIAGGAVPDQAVSVVPEFDTQTRCLTSYPIPYDGCLVVERSALEKSVPMWDAAAPEARAICTETAVLAGGSYRALQVCLEKGASR